MLFKLAGESGALLWRNTYQRSVGAWSHDRAAAMILGPDGDLFVGCSTESVISGGDASVLKISGVDGQVVWVRHLQGEGGGRHRLNEAALIYVNYAEWTDANPEGIYVGVVLNGDGEIDEEYVVDDTQ